jgi:hypothetical protein
MSPPLPRGFGVRDSGVVDAHDLRDGAQHRPLERQWIIRVVEDPEFGCAAFAAHGHLAARVQGR